MKTPYIFMNDESEYFYIFPNVFFSKSKGAFFANKKNKLWPFYLKGYFVKKRISKEGVQEDCLLNI